MDEPGGEPRLRAQPLHEAPRIDRVVAVVAVDPREQFGVVPQGFAVGAPEASQRPARHLLARIPLALPVVQQATRRKALAQADQQVLGEFQLVLASASVFHCGESMSSTDTKVGSPPIVSRTSFFTKSASTSRPSASIESHCASV